MRIQGLLGRPEGSGKQWWPLAIVPRPMVATDRMMMSDCTTVPDHGIEGGRLDGVPLRDQLAMPPSGTWERFEFIPRQGQGRDRARDFGGDWANRPSDLSREFLGVGN